MAVVVICFAVAFAFGIAFTLSHIDIRANAIELLLDGIIDRLNKLEKK